jgi:hypothetical protein
MANLNGQAVEMVFTSVSGHLMVIGKVFFGSDVEIVDDGFS